MSSGPPVLERLSLWNSLQSRIARGENIMQTYQYISSGNAELGFVALSEIQSEGVIKVGSRNPSSPVRPIEQQVTPSQS